MASTSKLKNILSYQSVFFFLTAVVFLAFLVLSFNLAHTMPSRLDEGAFLIKGYYYWTGKYVPFEDYGPWTNNIPLAYYIPGLAQYLFGPGLLTGRYFAIFLTFLTFFALFLLVKRLTNQWWALLAITPFAVNPALLMVYVQTISEGVVACLLSWSLFFFYREGQKNMSNSCGRFSFGSDSPDTAEHDLDLPPQYVPISMIVQPIGFEKV